MRLVCSEESFEKHQRLCNGAGAKTGTNKKSPTKKLPKENGRSPAGDNSEVPKPPSVPKYYVCFLCGRQYGSKRCDCVCRDLNTVLCLVC